MPVPIHGKTYPNHKAAVAALKKEGKIEDPDAYVATIERNMQETIADDVTHRIDTLRRWGVSENEINNIIHDEFPDWLIQDRFPSLVEDPRVEKPYSSIPDPRGDGEVLDNNGQGNIIDYTNKDNFMRKALGTNQAGLIVLNNEPKHFGIGFEEGAERPGIQLKNGTGQGSVGETVSIPGGLVEKQIGLKECPCSGEKKIKLVETILDKCGNCKMYVAGGRCVLVKGEIDPIEHVCDYHESGPIDSYKYKKPTITKFQANYRDIFSKMQEADYATIKHGKQKVESGSAQDRYLHWKDLPHSHVHTEDGKKEIKRFGTSETITEACQCSGTELPQAQIEESIKTPGGPESNLVKESTSSDIIKAENESKNTKDTELHNKTVTEKEPSKPTFDINDAWNPKVPNHIGLVTDQANGPEMFQSSGITLLQPTPQFDNAFKQVPIGETPPLQETKEIQLKKFLQYKYNPDPENPDCKICQPLDGTIWRDDDKTRPILPSEKFGDDIMNTHPHCRCTWISLLKPIDESKTEIGPRKQNGRKLGKIAMKSASERANITNKYFRRLAFDPVEGGAAWTLKKDKKLQEAMIPGMAKEAFPWITDEALKSLYKPQKGKFILVVATGPGTNITDHRRDGEEHRRKIPEDLLKKMTYTAVGKMMDINHTTPKKNPASGIVYDAEWNDKLKNIEMLLYETDEVILDAIRKGIIDSVSINGSEPRSWNIECETGECFRVPQGSILGESDGIALTYVVTDPQGLNYYGNRIPPAEPGVKVTKLHILE